ncbi:MAG: ketoacyl-ACP synthase III [Lentisphaerae bacterium]|jgi:3-oxoacyl-[acyl-carrier-protein] synthase III|nr:ketoacyl-ACP synthase III [Lentisphaerota bacterium]MBT4821118.1 ketoacyl-ACP synthase III [Lentisphaerota bacterium]MBT5610351.1 ketoacyl-ACP synthase III [Lentisphaerota bacterium]MBT7056179.1 ketoacyl-ACP synthase III [Lentisphaerota bacterium]MBT7841899.1 ketoacyl-ACP synthase III [Lentisphaerota bacterium]
MGQYGVRIVGTGSYAPPKVLTNHDLEEMVDTSDEWILARTGIKTRHIAADDQPTSSLAYEASLKALEAAGMAPDDIDLIIVATSSPDCIFPNTGCFLQRKLGATNAACFSLEAACSGFVYGFQVASGMLQSGMFENALLVGAEKFSTLLDWTDRTTCILFGDGAGAAVLRRVPSDDNGLLACKLGANGEFAELLGVPAGGTAMPLTHERLDQRLNCLQMKGREVFRLAVNAMVESCESVMADAGISIDQVRWLVPHQANTRIILGVGKRLGIPTERVFMNLDRYGNTSAATIPIALDEIARGELVSKDDYVLLTAFGGGLTWGALLLRW